MAAVATRPATSRRIRAVHVPRSTAAISSRRRHPWLSPTLAARGNPAPAHLPAAGGEGEGEEEEGARSCAACREAGAAREEEPDPREPRTPATSISSTSSLPRRSASPTSAASLLAAHRSPTPAHRPEATQVRTPPHLHCGRRDLRAEAERHRAAAGDAGHRARLGCRFLQVPPPSSTRAPPA
jgi:hypothetical protein